MHDYQRTGLIELEPLLSEKQSARRYRYRYRYHGIVPTFEFECCSSCSQIYKRRIEIFYIVGKWHQCEYNRLISIC